MRPGLTLTRCQLVTTATTARVSRVAAGPLCLHAVTLTPAGLTEPIRSCYSISFGLPQLHGGSAPALIVSRPAQRSLTLRPACSPSRLSDPLHRRLRRLRFLCRRSDCYRVERTSSRAGLSPAVDQRPFTAHVQWGFFANNPYEIPHEIPQLQALIDLPTPPP